MADYPLFRKIVRALALGEGAKARELTADMLDDDQREYANYVSAMFAETAGHILDKDHSLVAIKKLVDEMAYAYRKVDPPFRPMAMEALFRVLFYEGQSLDEVKPQDQMRFQLMAIRMIVDKHPEVFAQLDNFLADAEALAVQWESEA
jgi:hypothetical protein